MKRKVIAAIIGAAGMIGLATSSYGQGQVWFNTYSSTGYFPVTYKQAQTLLGLSGPSAGVNVDAELGFALGANQTSGFTLIPSTIIALSSQPAPVNGSGPVETGYITGGVVSGGIPGYTSGPITFEILAWVASGSGASGPGGTFCWLWLSMIQQIRCTFGLNHPFLLVHRHPLVIFLQSLPGNAVMTTPVPEPTTLALAGLGGLASLVALRRKKA